MPRRRASATDPATAGQRVAESRQANHARSQIADDDRVLTRVRALLAQAESTTYEAEAATFTAKRRN